MGEYPIQPQDKYVVRFPDGMRERLKALAAENGRSLNAEIIHRLERSLMSAQELREEDIHQRNIETRERLARIEKKLDAIDFEGEIDRIFERIAKEAIIKPAKPKPKSDSTPD